MGSKIGIFILFLLTVIVLLAFLDDPVKALFRDSSEPRYELKGKGTERETAYAPKAPAAFQFPPKKVIEGNVFYGSDVSLRWLASEMGKYGADPCAVASLNYRKIDGEWYFEMDDDFWRKGIRGTEHGS